MTPVIDWLLHEGRHLAAPEALVGELCSRVRAAGMPIDRVAFFFGTLHPQYFGIALHWNGVAVRMACLDVLTRSLRPNAGPQP